MVVQILAKRKTSGFDLKHRSLEIDGTEMITNLNELFHFELSPARKHLDTQLFKLLVVKYMGGRTDR